MDRETQGAALAAFIIMLAFGLGAFYLPSIMLVLGNYSTAVGGIFAVLFVAAFFMVFWLRGRQQRNRHR